MTDLNNDDASSGRDELLAEQARLTGVLNGLKPAMSDNGGTSGDPSGTRDLVDRLEEVGRKLNEQTC